MQKVYLNVALTVLIVTLSFFAGTLLAQTTSSVFHQAQDIKSGTFGSNVGGGNYFFPANVEASKQITAGTKFKVGVSEITSGKLTGLDAPTNSSDATNKAYVDAATGGVIAMSLTQYQYGMNDSCEWVRNGKYRYATTLVENSVTHLPPCLTSGAISCAVGNAIQCAGFSGGNYSCGGGEYILCGSDYWYENGEGRCRMGDRSWNYNCWELE